MKKSFEKVSEKVLPQKVRNIIWHRLSDLIVVNSGKYFEVQRISFKHETIFKREEKCEILQIIILNSKESIAVVLSDGTVNYININNGEVILSTSIKKAEMSLINQINSLTAVSEDSSLLPIKDELVFNSFSKIDVSKVGFFNDDFAFSHFFLFNKTKLTIDFHINLLINYGHLQVKAPPLFISSFTPNSLVYVNSINNNDYEVKLLTIQPELLSNINKANYQLAFSISMIDYIIQILSIITKIISKLGLILFDKYQAANNLTYIVSSENRDSYLIRLNKELKQVFLLGTMPEGLGALLQNDLFEAKSIYKVDQNVHFNLKNVQDILIESIKPLLNRLMIYFNELKFNKMIKDNKEMAVIEEKFGEIVYQFEEMIRLLLNLNFDYRNFLAWMLIFNSKETKQSGEGDTGKNSLNAMVVDHERCFSFILKEEYNMKEVLEIIEGEAVEEMQIEEEGEEREKKSHVILDSTKAFNAPLNQSINFLLNDYLKDNNLLHLIKGKEKAKTSPKTHKKEKPTIKKSLIELRQFILNVQSFLYNSCSTAISTLPQSFFQMKNLHSPISDLSLIQNDKGNHIFSFTNASLLKSILFLITFVPSTKSFLIGKISFSYETSITILSYQITKQNELILLIKSINQSLQVKYTIILSDLSNYTFLPLESSPTVFDLFALGAIEDIKIDSFVDVEASDNSFISIGERRLLALVNNSINKITIIDILNN